MKKFVSLLSSLLLILALVPQAGAAEQPFGDVPEGHWAYDAVLEAYNDGVMTGTAPGVFGPNGTLTIAQFATVLTRAFYNEDVLNSTKSATWPYRNIDAGEKHNLFDGLGAWMGEFETTREMMAQMMYNVMVDQGTMLPDGNEIQSTLNRIPDSSNVGDRYKTAVAVCYRLDLLSGVDANGTFAPKDVLNRAQTAVIYTRLKAALGGVTPAQTTEATLTNGMPVTEENVLALIEEFKNGKEPGEKAKEAGFTSYTNGATYDAYDPKYRIVLPSGPINGTECAKFAYAFFDDIFGEDAPIREVTNPADVRPGDLIHSPGHWWIAVEGSWYNSNYDMYGAYPVGGGSSGEIDWGNIKLNLNNADAIYTRYPN